MEKMKPGVILLSLALGAAATAADREVVHEFQGPMPTGVTVSSSGRIFVNFPRWGDPVDFTVGEIQNGRVVAYPNADINQADASKQAERFLSVQSVVVDPKDRLWVVDTG